VATQLKFAKLRERAIDEIDSSHHQSALSPIRKIILAQKYDVPRWLSACYAALCQQPQGLENAEAEMLGATITNCIWKAREAVREEANPMNPAQPAPFWESTQPPQSDPPSVAWNIQTYSASSVSRIVQQIFWLPDPQTPTLARPKGLEAS
jgi:hypothetical protein